MEFRYPYLILIQGANKENRSLCARCYGAEAITVHYPCGHVGTCYYCARLLRWCPVCGKIIEWHTDRPRVFGRPYHG